MAPTPAFSAGTEPTRKSSGTCPAIIEDDGFDVVPAVLAAAVVVVEAAAVVVVELSFVALSLSAGGVQTTTGARSAM